MILLLTGLVLFAVFMGALSLVTAPAALVMAVLICGWLLAYGVRTLFSRKEARRG